MLWDSYRKFLDRRLARYGEDEWMVEAIKETNTSALLDFGSLDEPSTRLSPEHPAEFFLPFEETAIEVKLDISRGESVQMLMMTTRPPHDKQANLVDSEWSVMLALVFSTQPNVLQLYKGMIRLHRITPKGSWDVYRTAPYSNCRYEINTGKCLSQWLAPRSSNRFAVDKETKEVGEHIASLATTCFGLIESANSPANWIVKVSDECARVVKRRGKRVDEKRTRYIVVPDRELDHIIRRPNKASDSIGRSPHRRRAHYRRLLSPHYRLKMGQTIFVKESWIGPKEAVFGNEKYTVMTELPCSATNQTNDTGD